MPTFAQHPFNFEGIRTELPSEFDLMPPEVRSLAEAALQQLYAELVQAAEDAGTSVFMEIQMDGEAVPDMTIDEIEAFQMGAMLSVTAVLESFIAKGLIHEEKFAKMLVQMMKDEHKKQKGSQ